MNENAAPVAAPKPARSARPTLDQAARRAAALDKPKPGVEVAGFGSSI